MADFYLTRRVFKQLIEIRDRSIQDFGSTRTKKYMADIYKGFQNAANNATRDHHRIDRSEPFFMQPVGDNHFALYHRFDNCIIIGAIFDQVMNVEEHIARLKRHLTTEILDMHKELKGR